MALMYEEAEEDLLTRPPRRPGQDSLVNLRLLLQGYLFIGVIESIFAHLMYFSYMQWEWGVSTSQLLLAFDKWGVDGVCTGSYKYYAFKKKIFLVCGPHVRRAVDRQRHRSSSLLCHARDDAA